MKLDIGRITFIDWMTFSDSIRNAKTGIAINILDKYIIEWDYEIPVSEGLRKLPSVLEVNKCLRKSVNIIDDRVQAIGISDVIVDLTKWSFDDYDRWENDRVNSNWVATETRIHEVAKLKDTEIGKPLSAVDGLRMVKAIIEVYQKSFLEVS